MPNKQRYGFLVFLVFILIIVQHCTKEYSREGFDTSSPPVDTTVIDTTQPQQQPPANSVSCIACANSDNFEEGKWSFKLGNTLLCGIIDTAITTPDRTAFTFFGPSACSTDTSLIISVYLNNYVLDRNRGTQLIPDVAFYYASLGSIAYPLISRTGIPFSTTINDYNHQTKIQLEL